MFYCIYCNKIYIFLQDSIIERYSNSELILKNVFAYQLSFDGNQHILKLRTINSHHECKTINTEHLRI